MVRLACFFPNCEIAYKKFKQEGKFEELKNIGLFKPPKDATRFEKWKKSMPKGKKEFTKDDLLCELHFTPEDFDRYEDICNVNKRKRLKSNSKLKDDAVPSIFYVVKTSLQPPNIVPKVKPHSVKMPDTDSVTPDSKLSATSRRILTTTVTREHQQQDILNLKSSAVFAIHDDKVADIPFSKNTEISNSADYKFDLISKTNNVTVLDSTDSKDLNSNETSLCADTSTLTKETLEDPLNEFSFPRDPLCHITYSNKNKKNFKRDRNSIRIVDFPPSLYEKNELCLNNKLDVDITVSDNIDDNTTAINDMLIPDTENPLLPKIVSSFTLTKSANASNISEISNEMSLFAKLKQTRPCTELFYKKLKSTISNYNCDLSSTKESFSCPSRTLNADLQNDADQYPLTSDLSKSEFRTVDPQQIIDKKSQRAYFCRNLSVAESKVEIVPVSHDEKSSDKFDFLFTRINEIKLSALWSYTLLQEKAVIFMRWNETYDNIVKHVFISTDFKIKVHVHKIPIKIDAYDKIDSLESLQILIKIIEDIHPCNGFGDSIRRSENCKGFVSSSYRCRPTVLTCIYCKLDKKKFEKEKEKQQSLRKQLSEVRQQCKELMKENTLLCQHLESCCDVEFKSYFMESTELGEQDIDS